MCVRLHSDRSTIPQLLLCCATLPQVFRNYSATIRYFSEFPKYSGFSGSSRKWRYVFRLRNCGATVAEQLWNSCATMGQFWNSCGTVAGQLRKSCGSAILPQLFRNCCGTVPQLFRPSSSDACAFTTGACPEKLFRTFGRPTAPSTPAWSTKHSGQPLGTRSSRE